MINARVMQKYKVFMKIRKKCALVDVNRLYSDMSDISNLTLATDCIITLIHSINSL